MPVTSNHGGSQGGSPGKDGAGQGGALADKPGQGGAHGKANGKHKDDPDQPGESLQASAVAGNVTGSQRQLHEIPTCD